MHGSHHPSYGRYFHPDAQNRILYQDERTSTLVYDVYDGLRVFKTYDTARQDRCTSDAIETLHNSLYPDAQIPTELKKKIMQVTLDFFNKRYTEFNDQQIPRDDTRPEVRPADSTMDSLVVHDGLVAHCKFSRRESREATTKIICVAIAFDGYGMQRFVEDLDPRLYLPLILKL